MGQVYTVSVQAARKRTAAIAKACTEAYLALKNKETVYARDLKALAQLHQRVAKVWESAQMIEENKPCQKKSM